MWWDFTGGGCWVTAVRDSVPKLWFEIRGGSRIFVLYRDETPAGRKGRRDQAKRRERKLSMERERRRWSREEKEFQAEAEEENRLAEQSMKRLNVLKDELKRKQQSHRKAYMQLCSDIKSPKRAKTPEKQVHIVPLV